MLCKISLLLVLTYVCGSDTPTNSLSLTIPRQISKELQPVSRSPSKAGNSPTKKVGEIFGSSTPQAARRHSLPPSMPANFQSAKNPYYKSPDSSAMSAFGRSLTGDPASDQQALQESPFRVEESYLGTESEARSHPDAPDERESIREIVTQIITYPPPSPEQNIDAWIRNVEGFMRVYETLPTALSVSMLRRALDKKKMDVLSEGLRITHRKKIEKIIDRAFKDPMIKNFIFNTNKQNPDDLQTIEEIDEFIESEPASKDIQEPLNNKIKSILAYIKKFRGDPQPQLPS